MCGSWRCRVLCIFAFVVNSVCSGRGSSFIWFKYINLTVSNSYSPVSGSMLRFLYIGLMNRYI